MDIEICIDISSDGDGTTFRWEHAFDIYPGSGAHVARTAALASDDEHTAVKTCMSGFEDMYIYISMYRYIDIDIDM